MRFGKISKHFGRMSLDDMHIKASELSSILRNKLDCFRVAFDRKDSSVHRFPRELKCHRACARADVPYGIPRLHAETR